jgi:hypothetical protein
MSLIAVKVAGVEGSFVSEDSKNARKKRVV